MDWSQIANLCVQIPLVVLVVWYSLEMNKQHRLDSEKRDEAWMQFLREERLQRKESMQSGLMGISQSTQSINKLADSVAELARSMIQHDTRAQERHEEVIRRIADDRRQRRNHEKEHG